MQPTWSRLVVAMSVALAMLGAVVVVEADKGKKMYTLEFAEDGALIRPAGWREWVYVGTPLTPNSLNEPAAAFPEFHSVYIDPESWEHWKKTGTFREGTILAKELALVGVTAASSGAGFFMGELQGFEIAYKNKKRFPGEPGGWAYFSFGHKAEPYENRTKAMPTANCAACHQANAKDDMVFTQFYPVLRAAKGAGQDAAGTGGQ